MSFFDRIDEYYLIFIAKKDMILVYINHQYFILGIDTFWRRLISYVGRNNNWKWSCRIVCSSLF